MGHDGPQRRRSRYWELDALRGVAMIWMAGFHLTWDLGFFGMVDVHMGRDPWPWFQRIIATTFLSLVGVSLTISYNRSGKTRGFGKYLVRGLKVFGLGLVITAVTVLFIPDEFVVFGILHLIGVCIVAAYPFLPGRRWWVSLIAGLALLPVGAALNRRVALHPWLIWLAVPQLGRPMADWYPVLPWFGLVLVGIAVGHALYPDGRRRYALPDWGDVPVIRELGFLGRHALLFYLVHQPVLIGVLYVVNAALAAR